MGTMFRFSLDTFSYFAVFGGEPVLPALPPLVAPDNGPKEIVQRSMVSASSSEEFVSRWPAESQEPSKTALTSRT